MGCGDAAECEGLVCRSPVFRCREGAGLAGYVGFVVWVEEGIIQDVVGVVHPAVRNACEGIAGRDVINLMAIVEVLRLEEQW